jgi:hypothetical protein
MVHSQAGINEGALRPVEALSWEFALRSKETAINLQRKHGLTYIARCPRHWERIYKFEEGGTFAARKIMATFELVDHARNAFDVPAKVSETSRECHAVAGLKRAGFCSLNGNHRLSNGKVARLWELGEPIVARWEQDVARVAKLAKA